MATIWTYEGKPAAQEMVVIRTKSGDESLGFVDHLGNWFYCTTVYWAKEYQAIRSDAFFPVNPENPVFAWRHAFTYQKI